MAKKHGVTGRLPGGNVWVPNGRSLHENPTVEQYRLKMSRWTLEVLPTMDDHQWQGLLDWINDFGHSDPANAWTTTATHCDK